MRHIRQRLKSWAEDQDRHNSLLFCSLAFLSSPYYEPSCVHRNPPHTPKSPPFENTRGASLLPNLPGPHSLDQGQIVRHQILVAPE